MNLIGLFTTAYRPSYYLFQIRFMRVKANKQVAGRREMCYNNTSRIDMAANWLPVAASQCSIRISLRDPFRKVGTASLLNGTCIGIVIC